VIAKDPYSDVGSLQRLFEAKARAELAAADAMLGGKLAVTGSGDPLASVLLVKGEPGADDLEAGHVLAGGDGVAAAKALQRLGHDPASVWAACSRPALGDPEAYARRLALVVEAVDPSLVVALDEAAAADVAAALARGVVGLGYGQGACVAALQGCRCLGGDPDRSLVLLDLLDRAHRALLHAAGAGGALIVVDRLGLVIYQLQHPRRAGINADAASGTLVLVDDGSWHAKSPRHSRRTGPRVPYPWIGGL
jgi:hypothetical protein